MMDRYKVLFVCLGNICRSPAAEAVFFSMAERSGVSGRFEVDSAGTYGGHRGERADSRMRQVATRRGYNLTSRSRQIRTDDFHDSDIILAMDDTNYELLFRLAPDVESSRKIRRMVEFATSKLSHDHIPDPYYEGAQGFETVFDLLENCCRGLLDNLTKNDLEENDLV